MVGRIFISHASQDREIAGAVCDALEARGVPCWLAPRDIVPGRDYAQSLYEAIVECRLFVLVLSARSAVSPQVLREVEQALRDGDPIVAFRIDDAALPPELQFRIGSVEWRPVPGAEWLQEVGLFAERVHAQLAADKSTGAEIQVGPFSNRQTWLGYPGVLRRLSATWMTVFIWICLVVGFGDLIGNLDALAGIGFNRSLFKEKDAIDRVAAMSGIQLIIAAPAIFVWVVWLCASYLTLETSGSPPALTAEQVPRRAFWPGRRGHGGITVLGELWLAVRRLEPPSTPTSEAPRPPSWLWLWWSLTMAMLPIMVYTAIIASENTLSDGAILTTAAGADLVWLVVDVLGLCFLGPLERRLRRLDARSPGAVEHPDRS